MGDAVPLSQRAGTPSSSMWPGPRSTSVPVSAWSRVSFPWGAATVGPGASWTHWTGRSSLSLWTWQLAFGLTPVRVGQWFFVDPTQLHSIPSETELVRCRQVISVFLGSGEDYDIEDPACYWPCLWYAGRASTTAGRHSVRHPGT